MFGLGRFRPEAAEEEAEAAEEAEQAAEEAVVPVVEAEADWPEESSSSASGESQWLFVEGEEEGPGFSDADSHAEDTEEIAAATALDVEPSQEEEAEEEEEGSVDSSAQYAECFFDEASDDEEEEEDAVSAAGSGHENSEVEEDVDDESSEEDCSLPVHCCEDEESTNCSLPREILPEAITRSGPTARLLVGGLLFGSSGVLSVGSEATSKWAPALQEFPAMTGAFCLGRLAVVGVVGKVTALARAVVLNVGCEAWPASTCLRIVAGDPYGFDGMRVGSLAPGEGADLLLDLTVPEASPTGCGQRSAWVLTDGLGQPFGPLLVLEVVWE